MENKEAIEMLERFQNPEPWEPQITSRAYEALEMAIAALKKQEQAVDKCCETCRHKDRLASEWRCSECFRASNLEDYWEPYTEEES